MITFALSNIIGGLLGVVPDVVKEIRDSRNHARELEHMTRLAEIQRENARITADAKVREVEAGVMHEEMKATREHLTAIIESQAKPTGIRWIDGFNAVLRPVCTSLIMGLMGWYALSYLWAIGTRFQAGQIAPEQFMTLIQAGFIGTMFEGVLGFLYGYRSTVNKK